MFPHSRCLLNIPPPTTFYVKNTVVYVFLPIQLNILVIFLLFEHRICTRTHPRNFKKWLVLWLLYGSLKVLSQVVALKVEQTV